MLEQVRHDWTVAQARALYELPLFELIDRARQTHLTHHPRRELQLCALMSVKTGGCPEDCGYCPQSAHYETGVEREQLLDTERVVELAERAKACGATRFCMGAAWRQVRDGPEFDRILAMVRGVKALGLEACCTLGMLTTPQAERLKAAGLDAYNHNIDTSPAHYGQIVSTRRFEERLATLERVRQAGITVCSGGIIGMGESVDDRCSMLVTLANLTVHPESVPINALVRVPGTPLAHAEPLDPFDFVRVIALSRIMMPNAKVRLSAGRAELSREAQFLCLYAGANSIFYGEKLLTTANARPLEDDALLRLTGLQREAPRGIDAATSSNELA